MLSFQGIIGSIPILLLSLDMNLEGTLSHTRMKAGTSLSALLIVAWSTMLKGGHCASKQDVDQHLEMGKKMLAAGQLADALSHYHAAVDGDPNNYMTYFRRATVYLALGKSKSALPDFDRVVELKPEFTAARLQRGSVMLKNGHLEEAKKDFEIILQKDPSHADALKNLGYIDPVFQDRKLAQEMFDHGDFQGAINILNNIIEICPWDPNLRELRAECYINQGDYFKATGDIRATTKLRNDNTAAFYKLSQLYYEMGEADTSLMEVRECLKLDPDHKECFPHYKKVKKLVKQKDSIANIMQEERWEDCVSKAEQMLKTESQVFVYVHRANGHRCHCHSKAGHIKQAFQVCNEILDVDENNVEALCDRAETYILNEQFEEAVKDYQKAETINNDLNRIREGLQRAQKLLKQSLKRDYYKILGLKRNCRKNEIIKAYRKLAVQWHPDKFEEGEGKKKAEKMFIDIAAAKEVLSDPEKRAKFDNGEDPLDPENQQGGGPWNQGFNPFGTGGFNFKFHFQ